MVPAPRLVVATAALALRACLPADLQPADDIARHGDPPSRGRRRLCGRLALQAAGRPTRRGAATGLVSALCAPASAASRCRARNRFESVVKVVLIACSAVAILTTVGIVFSVLFETLRFFARYPVFDFLFGLQWSPQTAIREDQVG